MLHVKAHAQIIYQYLTIKINYKIIPIFKLAYKYIDNRLSFLIINMVVAESV